MIALETSIMIKNSTPTPAADAHKTVLIPKLPRGDDRAHYLAVTEGPRAGWRLELGDQPLLIGRDATADVDLEDHAVSGRHCEVLLIRGHLMIRDLGSSNGTYIDDEALGNEPRELPVGAVLQVGSSVLEHVLSSKREVAQQVQLTQDLDKAAGYVEALLPKPIDDDNLRARWRFIPSAKLGGDAFGYHWLDDDCFSIYLLDVCGHGAPSALHSVSIINMLRQQVLPGVDFTRPDEVLAALNSAFPMSSYSGMYFTIWYGIYRSSDRQLSFSSAGHPPALLLSVGDTDGRYLLTRNPPIGMIAERTYRVETVEVPEASRLYLFSDGVYEVPLPNGTYGTQEEFLQLLSGVGAREEDLQYIEAAVREIMQGEDFEDDFSLVAVDFP